jgi:hypothetical protein
MIMRSRVFLIGLMLLPSVVLAAPKSSDDGSGPRAALLMYDKLVGPNDADKAIGLYYASNTRERVLAAVLAKLDGAVANLRKKAADKFGQDAADAMIRSIDATTADDINQAKITVNGDTATVLFPHATSPSSMVRVNGEWKLSLKPWFRDVRSSPRDLRKSLARLASSTNEIAGKIEQGQYSKAADATNRLQEAFKAAFASDSSKN